MQKQSFSWALSPISRPVLISPPFDHLSLLYLYATYFIWSHAIVILLFLQSRKTKRYLIFSVTELYCYLSLSCVKTGSSFLENHHRETHDLVL